jgi:hypothetical protein
MHIVPGAVVPPKASDEHLWQSHSAAPLRGKAKSARRPLPTGNEAGADRVARRKSSPKRPALSKFIFSARQPQAKRTHVEVRQASAVQRSSEPAPVVTPANPLR